MKPSLLTITNPIDHTRQRKVVIMGEVKQSHINKAIETLDDNTPTGLIPDSKDQYLVNIAQYSAR